MAVTNRRTFIGSLLTALAVATIDGCKTDKPEPIDTSPPKISREGIELEVSGLASQEIEKKLGRGLLGYWGGIAGSIIAQHRERTHPVLHTFLRINGYDIYGDPADPLTGERRELNDLGPAPILQVFVVPQADNEADINRRGHQRIASAPVNLSEEFDGLGKARMFGKLLGMAAVINHAKIPYAAYSTNKQYPPSNSNAVYSAELEVLGICLPASCYAEASRLAPADAYGINYGLPDRLRTKDGTSKYYDLAVQGKTMEQLLKIFNDDRKADLAIPAIHPSFRLKKASALPLNGPGG